jgi:hypothetical protein
VGSDVYGLAMVISEVRNVQIRLLIICGVNPCIVLLGCAQILTQEVPMDTMFRNSTSEECYHHLVEENRRPVLPDSVPFVLREILAVAWTTNPSMRPACGDIANVAIQCLEDISATES